MEVLEFKVKSGVRSIESETVKPKGQKIPVFVEGKNEMDSYLHRFERYVTALNWKPLLRATHLSALFKGRALDVNALLLSKITLHCNGLKEALLNRFELDEDGFF